MNRQMDRLDSMDFSPNAMMADIQRAIGAGRKRGYTVRKSGSFFDIATSPVSPMRDRRSSLLMMSKDMQPQMAEIINEEEDGKDKDSS